MNNNPEEIVATNNGATVGRNQETISLMKYDRTNPEKAIASENSRSRMYLIT